MLTSDPASPPRHLAGLDGLRALAVLLVMADHLLPNFAGGGVGVNLFFVLSGFLITTLLVRERQGTGRIHLGLFYLRRVLRLYPALLVMLVVGVLVTGARLSGLFAATYTANLAGLVGFSPEPFGHTWSLAAEEQFYLVWPLLLILLFPYRRLLIAVVAGLAAASAAAYAVGVLQMVAATGEVSYAVFNPLWQAHGLLIGVLLALVTGRYSRSRFALPRPNAWVAGALAVVLGIAVASSATVGLHLYAVWDVAVELTGAVLILGLVQGSGWVRRVFDNRVAVWIGHRSYALYLWHYLVFRVMSQHHIGHLPQLLVGVPLTFVIAWASGRWIEAPFLRLKDRLRPAGAERRVRRDPVLAS